MEELVDAAKNALLNDSYVTFNNLMVAVANPHNMRNMYNNLQSLPHPHGNDGFQVTMYSPSGNINTPFFGNKEGDDFTWDPIFYGTDHNYHYVLDMSTMKMETLDKGGAVVVKLDVDTRTVEGWEEWVEVRQNHHQIHHHIAMTTQVSKGGTKTFRHFRSSKDISWVEAKELCEKERGGRLATIMSEAEQLAVRQDLPMQGSGVDFDHG